MEPIIGFFILLIIAVPVILLIVFIAKTNALATRVHWLEQEVLRLRATPIPPTISKEPVVSSTSPPVAEQKTMPATPPPSIPPTFAPPMRAPTSASQENMGGQRSRAREEWEAFVGGKLLNRIGALALIIGVGFFLKYAFDNNWITESMRVMLGAVGGVALLLLGARFHRKEYHVFAQGLIGAGIAILYLSVYASFNFYHLVSQTAAFILMSAVTLITFFHAFKYDSLAISILGWAGGYLTPFMLSTGVANEIGLFSYIDILEAGLLAVVLIRQSWMILEFLTLAGTYFTFMAWQSTYYSEDSLLLTVLFLTLFWLLFYIADLYRIISKQQPHPLRQLINILNAGAYYAYLYALVNNNHHEVAGLLTIILAAFYVLPALLTLRTNPKSLMLRDYVMTTVVLTIIATSIQFSGFVTVTVWACEAVVLMWCAERCGYQYLANAVLIFFVIIIGKLFLVSGALSYAPIGDYSPLINKRFLTFVFVSASMGASAYILRGSEHRERETFRAMLNIGAIVLFLLLLSAEVRDVFELKIYDLRQSLGGLAPREDVRTIENMKQLSLSALWLCSGIALMIGGIWRRSRGVRVFAIVVLGISILKIFVYDLSFLQTLYRIFSFIGLGLILLAASYMYQRYKEMIFGETPGKGADETVKIE
jgi:uncharacterized membrane protein